MTNLQITSKRSIKNIILTYQLEKNQLKALQESLPKRTIPVTIAEARTIQSIFRVTPFLALLNFANVPEETQQAFLTQCLECRKAKKKMPSTYIFHCQVKFEKMAKLFVNRDLFTDRQQLKLILLQECKGLEGKRKERRTSLRVERVLYLYHTLMKDDKLPQCGTLGKRSFYKDLEIIKLLIPDVTYDKAKKIYVAHHVPDKEAARKKLLAATVPTRIKRVLLFYQQLLYDGWISKEEADKICDPVSLRTFQRDLALIDQSDDYVYYDMDQRKYILAQRRNEEPRVGRVKWRNLYNR